MCGGRYPAAERRRQRVTERAAGVDQCAMGPPQHRPARASGGALRDSRRDRSPSRRMLVIVNPYATTVSEGLKNLVVYALRGRYDVTAVDTKAPGHATELCRAGRAARATTSSSRSAATGPSTRRRTAWSGPTRRCCCLPGGRANVCCRMLGIPTDVVDATEHLLAIADDWHPRRVDVGPCQRALLPVLLRGRSRRQRGRARRRQPAPEGSAGRVVLRLGRGQHLQPPLPRAPAAAGGVGRRRVARRGHRGRPERRALHLFRRPTGRHGRRVRRLQSAICRRSCCIAPPRWRFRRSAGERCPSGRGSPITAGSRAFSGSTEMQIRRPTSARCRCRSTATTSARSARRGSACCREALLIVA